MTRTVTPMDRRVTAITNLVNDIVLIEHGAAHIRQDFSHADVASKIRNLTSLGRSARWTSTIENWAKDVEKPDADLLFWVLQGQVFALHAA